MDQARLYAPDSDETQSNRGRAAPAHDTQASLDLLVVDDPVRSRLVAPVLLLFVLGTLDVPLTLDGLARGGVELNPIARSLLDHTGPEILMPARLALLALATYAITRLAPAAPRAARACLAAGCVVFGGVDLLSLTQLVIL